MLEPPPTHTHPPFSSNSLPPIVKCLSLSHIPKIPFWPTVLKKDFFGGGSVVWGEHNKVNGKGREPPDLFGHRWFRRRFWFSDHIKDRLTPQGCGHLRWPLQLRLQWCLFNLKHMVSSKNMSTSLPSPPTHTHTLPFPWFKCRSARCIIGAMKEVSWTCAAALFVQPGKMMNCPLLTPLLRL